MNFVADESCAEPVIRALVDAGHDVISIAKMARGADDERVLELALTQNRVLAQYGASGERQSAPQATFPQVQD